MIEPNYFDHEDDRRDLIAGVRDMREAVSQPASRAVVCKAILPGPSLQTETERASAVRSLSTTGYHPVGTCVIDVDGDFEAVLDSRLFVSGVDRLRAVDGSSLPDQVSGNVNALIVMMTEKAADMRWGHPPLLPDHPGETA